MDDKQIADEFGMWLEGGRGSRLEDFVDSRPPSFRMEAREEAATTVAAGTRLEAQQTAANQHR
jgi:hypothetical protein